MIWFDKLRQVLSAYYPASPQDIVGYLQGSKDPMVWYRMLMGGRQQMIVLGSVEPIAKEWEAAGVAQRGAVQVITLNDLAANGFMIVYGGFVLRPWGKIIRFDKKVEDSYEQNTLSNFRRNTPKAASGKESGKDKVAAAVLAVLAAIEARAREYSSDHKAQAGLTQGSAGNFVGFFGYWTNHLFNTDPPALLIWDEVWTNLAHARSLIREGRVSEVGPSLVAARFGLMHATAVYFRWKDGIEGAGKKMQIAIGATAIAIVIAAAAATVASAAAGVAATADAAAGAADAVATIEGVNSSLAQAETLMARIAVAGSAGETTGVVASYGEALEEATEAVDSMLKMVR